MVLLFAVAGAIPAAFAQAGGTDAMHVVQYHATIDNVKYVYGIDAARRRICARATFSKPTRSIVSATRSRSRAIRSAWPRAIIRSPGPFYIDGAEPGDTLAIDILILEVNGNQGVGALRPDLAR